MIEYFIIVTAVLAVFGIILLIEVYLMLKNIKMTLSKILDTASATFNDDSNRPLNMDFNWKKPKHRAFRFTDKSRAWITRHETESREVN